MSSHSPTRGRRAPNSGRRPDGRRSPTTRSTSWRSTVPPTSARATAMPLPGCRRARRAAVPMSPSQIAVKHRYGLSVTAAERDALVRVLTTCPGQALPRDPPLGVASRPPHPPPPPLRNAAATYRRDAASTLVKRDRVWQIDPHDGVGAPGLPRVGAARGRQRRGGRARGRTRGARPGRAGGAPRRHARCHEHPAACLAATEADHSPRVLGMCDAPEASFFIRALRRVGCDVQALDALPRGDSRSASETSRTS